MNVFLASFSVFTLISIGLLYRESVLLSIKRLFKVFKMSGRKSLGVNDEALSPQDDCSQYCIADLMPKEGLRLKVLSGKQLLSLRDVQPWVRVIEKQAGFLHASFVQDCEPVLIAVAEYVQLLPASQSHHHANPGGLLVHLLESAAFAVSIRKSRTLPVNAPVETIAKRQHRWTYAVLLASILHDIGKPLADLNVKIHIDGEESAWNPLASSMKKLGAELYEVNFAKTRNYYLHEKLPILFLKSLVPEASIQWLSQDSDCFNELTQFLSRDRNKSTINDESSTAQPIVGAIQEIITLADQKSVAQNLLNGSRIRFNAAIEAPLVEKLVTGFREMLQQQLLPLNRAGAAGWVFEGDLWIAGKRLADELRAYLLLADIKGIPGADKNDRVFDTFQEYGFLIKNPLNNRSIWHVKIEQSDGWISTLTVLRFPLNKLYLDLGSQPMPMSGTITVLAGKANEIENSNDERIRATPIQVSDAIELSVDPKTTCESESASPVNSISQARETHGADATSGTSTTSLLDEVMAASLGVSVSKLALESPTAALNLGDGFLSIKKPSPTTNNSTTSKSAASPNVQLVKPAKSDERSKTTLEEPAYLPDEETANHDKQNGLKPVVINAERTMDSNTRHKKPEKIGRTLNIAGKSIELLAPVTPNTDKQIPRLTGPLEPLEAAVAFMRWLQEGIVNGGIQINQTIAQVHFVQLCHPAIAKGTPQSLMLLVTPLCFRDFAESNPQFGDSKTVQSAFIKAKWHVTAETGNINILRFKTPGSSNGTPKLLSCIGVQYPEKFVNPVPSANELLTYDDAMTRQFMTKPKDGKP